MSNLIGSPIEHDLVFETNADANKNLSRVVQARANTVMLGGGVKAIERHKAKGKLTARERIDRLVDAGSSFLEIGLFTAFDMYQAEGGCPSAGVVAGVGIIHGRECMIVASASSSDSTL